MENLTRTIQTAIQSNDYAALSALFSDYGPNSWQSVGQGEQRSLAADFIQQAVSNESFLEPALQNPEMVQVFLYHGG